MATADDYIAAAAREQGYTENPPGSNRTKFAAEAGHANGYPWCASFVVAIARRCGIKLSGESAYTPNMAGAFRNAGRYSTKPSRGALAFFDFPDSKYRIQHVGIVESWDASTVTCIEGNTSSGSAGSQDNGGGVYRRRRSRAHVVGYGAPAFSAPSAPAPASTPTTHVLKGDDDMDKTCIPSWGRFDAAGRVPFYLLVQGGNETEFLVFSHNHARLDRVDGTYAGAWLLRQSDTTGRPVGIEEKDGRIVVLCMGGGVYKVADQQSAGVP